MVDQNMEKILKVNQPTITGRVYPREVVERAIAKIKHPIFAGLFNSEMSVDLDRITHVCENFRIEDEYLVCDTRILPTPVSEMVLEIEGLSFSATGSGTVDASGNVSDYELLYVSVQCEIISER